MKTYIESPAEFEAMTPEQRSAYRCAVDAAHAAGGRVEAINTCLRNPSRWVPDPNPSWSWKACIYRIARKPLEAFQVIYVDGSRDAYAYDSPEQAVRNTCRPATPHRIAHFIEAPNE